MLSKVRMLKKYDKICVASEFLLNSQHRHLRSAKSPARPGGGAGSRGSEGEGGGGFHV